MSVKIIPECERITPTAEMIDYVFRYGFYRGNRKAIQSLRFLDKDFKDDILENLYYALHETLGDDLREYLNTDKGIGITGPPFQFVVFDIPASELNFGNHEMVRNGDMLEIHVEDKEG